MCFKPHAGRNGDGATALFYASCAGFADVAFVLLSAGASQHVAHRRSGATPLLCAAGAGHARLVAMLLEFGADAQSAQRDGATALHVAAAEGPPFFFYNFFK